MARKTVTIKDVGPIKLAEIPYDPAGGVIELRGAQGVGKSTALRAIETAATGKGKLPVRDRAKAASIDGFGMQVKVGARTSRTGEPEVVSLEGKFSIADLVDPGIANAEAADARRIKALIQIAGVEANIRAFEDWEIPEGFEWSPETSEATDLLVMAEKVKRDIEAAARKAEDRFENATGRVQALRQATAAIDGLPGKEITADAAQGQLEAAIATQAAIKRAVAADKERLDAAAVGRENLARVAGSYTGGTVAEALEEQEKAAKQAEARRKIAAGLRAELAEAEAAAGKADDRKNTANLQLLRAQEHARLVAAWQTQIDNGADVADRSADVESAETALAEARQLVANVAVRDKLAGELAEAKKQGEVAIAAKREADTLRDAAKRVDQVLSDAVGELETELYVEAGRLLFDTDRGPTFFGELSDGERARIVIEIAIDQAAKLADDERLGIFVIPQAMWGELQPANREWTHARCREKRVIAYTALATDDHELTAEVM